MDEPPSNSLLETILTHNLPYLIFTALIVILCGFISATESAFFSLTPEEVDAYRKGRSEKDKIVAGLLSAPRLLLTVLTTWKYLALMSAAIVFTIAVNLTDRVGMIWETFGLTVLFTFFSLILPKIYGSEKKRTIVNLSGKLCATLVRITTPIVSPLLRMSFKVERKLESLAEENSVKELTQVLELAAAEKETTEDEREILRGIVNFGTLSVEDVMRPKNEIHSVDDALNFHDLLIYIKKSGFSRIPVYHDDPANVVGMLYIKDLLPYLGEGKTFQWHKLLRSAYYVPSSKKIDLLLKDFQEKRVHMALVLDEGGTLAGVITLEDIIEEIIGDIHDEFDEVGAYYRKIDEYTFVVDSKIPVHELCRLLDIDPEVFPQVTSETESLGVFLQDLQEELPRIGDQITAEPFTFVIEAVDHKRIRKIRVHIHEKNEF